LTTRESGQVGEFVVDGDGRSVGALLAFAQVEGGDGTVLREGREWTVDVCKEKRDEGQRRSCDSEGRRERETNGKEEDPGKLDGESAGRTRRT
jgi:hypothetical protein